MTKKHSKYHGYYLVNDNEMTEEADVDFDFPKQNKRRRCLCITATTLSILAILFFVIVFVILPLVFMSLPGLQTFLIFTRFGLPDDREFYDTQNLAGFKNRYITFGNTTTRDYELKVTLGLYQLLPVSLAYDTVYNTSKDQEFNFDEALLHSKYPILIYFHGTGEARSDNLRKYELFAPYFQVIVFDYRGYGDSTKGPLTEENIVGDCVKLYKWVRNKTTSDIYVWGHSLGAAIAVESVAVLESNNIIGKGLIIESAFTNLRDELYVHPYAKFYAWLPWFNATIANPVRDNGLLFETDKHLATIKSPVMVLHAEDDKEIPWEFGKELYEIASKRPNSINVFHHFNETLEHGHNYIYEDPFMKLHLMNFLAITNSSINGTG